MMEYFSERYDLNDPLAKDVETIDYLFTGFVIGFDLLMITKLVDNCQPENPLEFGQKLAKWRGITIHTKKQFYDCLEDVLGWDSEHATDVYNYGIKTLYLFRPEDFDKWNLTLNKANLN